MELTLLGTGSPQPSPVRAGPSQHLSIGGDSVLVDVGSGTVRRMVEVSLDAKDVDVIFVTHMHSDHTIDLAHALITGWIRYRTKPYTIVGPPQTNEFVARLLYAFEFDLKLRKLNERVGADVMRVEVIEVNDGESFERDGWRATAVAVDHGYVKPSLGFVFEEDDRKLVISGDTSPCQAIVDASQGADLLVHELMRATPKGDPHGAALEQVPLLRRRILESHTCPHDMGTIARDAGVPKLVLTHLPADSDDAWVRETVASTYHGDVTVGRDLLRMTV